MKHRELKGLLGDLLKWNNNFNRWIIIRNTCSTELCLCNDSRIKERGHRKCNTGPDFCHILISVMEGSFSVSTNKDPYVLYEFDVSSYSSLKSNKFWKQREFGGYSDFTRLVCPHTSLFVQRYFYRDFGKLRMKEERARRFSVFKEYNREGREVLQVFGLKFLINSISMVWYLRRTLAFVVPLPQTSFLLLLLQCYGWCCIVYVPLWFSGVSLPAARSVYVILFWNILGHFGVCYWCYFINYGLISFISSSWASDMYHKVLG